MAGIVPVLFVSLWLSANPAWATGQDFALVIDLLDFDNEQISFQTVEVRIDDAILAPDFPGNRVTVPALPVRQDMKVCVKVMLADNRSSDRNCRELAYVPEHDPEQDGRYNVVALLEFLTAENAEESLPECCDSRFNPVAGNYHVNDIPDGEQRIIFSRFSFSEGNPADQSVRAVLDKTSAVLIVTQKSNGESRMLRDTEAIAMMRRRTFVKPNSWELTAKGWLGYETEESD